MNLFYAHSTPVKLAIHHRWQRRTLPLKTRPRRFGSAAGGVTRPSLDGFGGADFDRYEQGGYRSEASWITR